MGEPSADNRCFPAGGPIHPDLIVLKYVEDKGFEKDEPAVYTAERVGSSYLFALQYEDEIPVPRDEEKIQEHMLRKFRPVAVVKHYSPHILIKPRDMHTANGDSASEGGTLSAIEPDLHQHGKSPLMKGNDNHIIDIPAHADEDFPPGRFLSKKRDQNPGAIAILCIGVSAQTILGLVGGPGAMSLPEPIFYYAAAANSIAFSASSLALFLKKKPRVASILEKIGFTSAIATFLLMMRAVVQGK